MPGEALKEAGFIHGLSAAMIALMSMDHILLVEIRNAMYALAQSKVSRGIEIDGMKQSEIRF